MGTGPGRIGCPECGRSILRKNLSKHYTKYHPGHDHFETMQKDRNERRKERLEKISDHNPIRSFLTVVLALGIMSGAGVLAYLLVREVADDSPDVAASKVSLASCWVRSASCETSLSDWSIWLISVAVCWATSSNWPVFSEMCFTV